VTRRWNGWGDDAESFPLPPTAAPFLAAVAGPATPPHDARFADVVGRVPASRLPAHRLVSTDAADRVRHARGQSLPDWIALRSGRIGAFPDGVARPQNPGEVRELLRWVEEVGARLIPYGGGTSVAGHINPPRDGAPVLTVALRRMSALKSLDENSLLATFGAGITGPALEHVLEAHGYTLGHFPQSFELSTLGGWVATRSSGQQSIRYGRIEQLFAGGRLEAPVGTLELPTFPASAAGPDLRQIVLGSEGRLGLITEATVRITPRPEREAFHAVFFRSWPQAVAATRTLVQADLPFVMVRLSTPTETTTTLALAGHALVIGAFERVLRVLGAGAEKCMLILGFAGRAALVEAARDEALGLARAHGGIHVGQIFGREWHKNRFRSPYLRNSLWDAGYAVDTLETATTWSRVPAMVSAIEAAIRGAVPEQQVHVFTHLSHLYPTGSSIYTTYIFRLRPDPDETLSRWERMKTAASRAIVDQGGTISHQHGVGADHLPYLEAEKGALGMQTLARLREQYDPRGLLNPGKLIP
jgi:alkyldihydroxyacetonephosphate synthase